jgi:pilus assembly protein Flp/PilA
MLFSPKEKGQGLVEYALILVLIAIVILAGLMILGPLMSGIVRFFARYWLYGVGIFVFSFLGCLFALSVDRWRNGR